MIYFAQLFISASDNVLGTMIASLIKSQTKKSSIFKLFVRRPKGKAFTFRSKSLRPANFGYGVKSLPCLVQMGAPQEITNLVFPIILCEFIKYVFKIYHNEALVTVARIKHTPEVAMCVNFEDRSHEDFWSLRKMLEVGEYPRAHHRYEIEPERYYTMMLTFLRSKTNCFRLQQNVFSLIRDKVLSFVKT